MEKDAVKDSAEESSINSLSINSVHFNKHCSILMENLKMSAGPNNIMIPYKVGTGSDGNMMSLYIYKKKFPKINNEKLEATKNILLKTYNKTTITQLGSCIVEIEYKNNKKKCRFFVVPRNGQALLGMPDWDVLNIIKMNINAIGAEQTGGSDKCCKNMHTIQGASQSWKQAELRSATQTWTAFQNETIKVSHENKSTFSL